MKLLFLTFYYPPDLSAGSFRSHALIQALEPYRTGQLEIDLLTTMPNRYHEMVNEAKPLECETGLCIRRFTLPTHRSGMVDQSRAFSVFAKAVFNHVSTRQYDAVFATSSRLMTAVLAAHIARTKRIPLHLDIRDLFTDTIDNLFARSPLKLTTPLFQALERWSYGAAERMTIVSEGFRAHVQRIAPSTPVSCFTNGIDDEFLKSDFTGEGGSTDPRPLILYAGNIGEGQGLHHVIPEAAKRLALQARFRVIGGGGRAARLSERVAAVGADVELLPAVPREKLHEHYREADMLLLHLNSYPAFHKVLPSKIFEYGATGKPILAGVAGSAARFIEANLAEGSAIFGPCDVEEMVRAFETVAQRRGPIDRTAFRRRFSRGAIMREMAAELMDSLASSRKKA